MGSFYNKYPGLPLRSLFTVQLNVLFGVYEVKPSATQRANAVVTCKFCCLLWYVVHVDGASRVQHSASTRFLPCNLASSCSRACKKKRKTHSNRMIHGKMGGPSLDSMLQHRVLFRNPSLDFKPC